MKGSHSKSILVLFLALFLVAFTGVIAGPRRHSPWVGRWRTMDSPGDESINTLSVAYIPGEEIYRLTWQETYFTLCDGEPGVGRGAGSETTDGLGVDFEFFCQGELAMTLTIPFVYNIEEDTVTSYGSTLIQTWDRITHRLPGK